MLAVALFLIGSVMITIGALMLTGYIETQVYSYWFEFDDDCLLFFVSIKIVHGH